MQIRTGKTRDTKARPSNGGDCPLINLAEYTVSPLFPRTTSDQLTTLVCRKLPLMTRTGVEIECAAPPNSLQSGRDNRFKKLCTSVALIPVFFLGQNKPGAYGSDCYNEVLNSTNTFQPPSQRFSRNKFTGHMLESYA